MTLETVLTNRKLQIAEPHYFIDDSILSHQIEYDGLGWYSLSDNIYQKGKFASYLQINLIKKGEL